VGEWKFNKWADCYGALIEEIPEVAAARVAEVFGRGVEMNHKDYGAEWVFEGCVEGRRVNYRVYERGGVMRFGGPHDHFGFAAFRAWFLACVA
jgi:hypothetical protein